MGITANCTECGHQSWYFTEIEYQNNSGRCSYCLRGHTHPKGEKGEVKKDAYHMRRQICIVIKRLDEQGLMIDNRDEHVIDPLARTLNNFSIEDLREVTDSMKKILLEEKL